ncbi:MAG: hypothetical protein PHY29_02795 [Syntrophales bacterium]|nr:hypothetical protein [Syntrophales bacterium]
MLTWTKEKPKEPGWYWRRTSSLQQYIREVLLFGDALWVRNENGAWKMEDMVEGEWAGPIEEPGEVRPSV